MSFTEENEIKNDYYVIKKYCPAVRKNVIMKVANDHGHTEYCTNATECLKSGGCTNSYLKRNDIIQR